MGVPGDAVTAIMIGALTIQGLTPAIFALCVIINFEVPPLAWTVTLIVTPIIYCLLSYGRFCKVFTNYWDMTDGNEAFLEKQLEEK